MACSNIRMGIRTWIAEKVQGRFRITECSRMVMEILLYLPVLKELILKCGRNTAQKNTPDMTNIGETKRTVRFLHLTRESKARRDIFICIPIPTSKQELMRMVICQVPPKGWRRDQTDFISNLGQLSILPL